jgi:hypothetical protein
MDKKDLETNVGTEKLSLFSKVRWYVGIALMACSVASGVVGTVAYFDGKKGIPQGEGLRALPEKERVYYDEKYNDANSYMVEGLMGMLFFYIVGSTCLTDYSRFNPKNSTGYISNKTNKEN